MLNRLALASVYSAGWENTATVLVCSLATAPQVHSSILLVGGLAVAGIDGRSMAGQWIGQMLPWSVVGRLLSGKFSRSVVWTAGRSVSWSVGRSGGRLHSPLVGRLSERWTRSGCWSARLLGAWSVGCKPGCRLQGSRLVSQQLSQSGTELCTSMSVFEPECLG